MVSGLTGHWNSSWSNLVSFEADGSLLEDDLGWRSREVWFGTGWSSAAAWFGTGWSSAAAWFGTGCSSAAAWFGSGWRLEEVRLGLLELGSG